MLFIKLITHPFALRPVRRQYNENINFFLSCFLSVDNTMRTIANGVLCANG